MGDANNDPPCVTPQELLDTMLSTTSEAAMGTSGELSHSAALLWPGKQSSHRKAAL